MDRTRQFLIIIDYNSGPGAPILRFEAFLEFERVLVSSAGNGGYNTWGKVWIKGKWSVRNPPSTRTTAFCSADGTASGKELWERGPDAR